jgi:purine-binding chemotaxis protein CheW
MNEDFVVLELARQQYALSVRQVREVLPRATLTALPGAPSGVLGVLSLRGALLPVVDARQRLRLPGAPPSIGQRIVVVELPRATVGLLVDAVVGIVSRPAERAVAPEPDGALVRQVAEIEGQVVSVLEPEAVVGPVLTSYMAALAPAATGAAGRALAGESGGRALTRESRQGAR